MTNADEKLPGLIADLCAAIRTGDTATARRLRRRLKRNGLRLSSAKRLKRLRAKHAK